MSDEMSTPVPAAGSSVAAAPAQKVGFLSTPTGKIVAIVGGLTVLGIIAGIAVATVLYVFGSQVVDELEGQLQEQSDPSGPTGSDEATAGVTASGPAAVVANSEVFTFRDVFAPLLKALPEPTTTSSTTSSTTTTSTPDTVTPTTANTLYLNDIVTENGVPRAVLMLNGTTYRLAAGERIPGTPWQVLRIGTTQVTMLYGDTQVTLSVGQGKAK